MGPPAGTGRADAILSAGRLTPTRRDALRLLAGGALAGVVPLPLPAAGPEQGPGSMLAAYVDVLLPADALSPAASQLGVHEAILMLADDVEPLARLIGMMRDWLDGSGRGAFATLDPADREALVAYAAAADPDTPEGRFHLLIRLFALEFYYATPEAIAGLDLAVAPQPEGYPPPWP